MDVITRLHIYKLSTGLFIDRRSKLKAHQVVRLNRQGKEGNRE